MSRWATVALIAGVDLSGCRAEVVDGFNSLSDYAGSSDNANDNTAHVQTFNRGKKGIKFGIQLTSTQITDLNTILANIRTAQAARDTFRVHIVDGMFDIDVNAEPDYDQQWLTFGEHSEGWAQGVLFRFISKSAHV